VRSWRAARAITGSWPIWILDVGANHGIYVVEALRGYEISEMNGPTLLHCRLTSPDARP
jgi:hypothetical protein